MKTSYNYQPETLTAFDKIPKGTVAHQCHSLGMSGNDPIIVTLDSLIRYAKAHESSFGSKLSDDYFLGPCFLSALTSIRELLNGNGGAANEISASTNAPCRDSKDNVACERMFWNAMEISGFTESDI